MMWASLSKLMTLPDATKIYCGHEYTQNNGRFALTLEPGNQALAARMNEVNAARAKGAATMPSTMGLEKPPIPSCGRTRRKSARAWAWKRPSDVAVFGEIRKRKDNF